MSEVYRDEQNERLFHAAALYDELHEAFKEQAVAVSISNPEEETPAVLAGSTSTDEIKVNIFNWVTPIGYKLTSGPRYDIFLSNGNPDFLHICVYKEYDTGECNALYVDEDSGAFVTIPGWNLNQIRATIKDTDFSAALSQKQADEFEALRSESH